MKRNSGSRNAGLAAAQEEKNGSSAGNGAATESPLKRSRTAAAAPKASSNANVATRTRASRLESEEPGNGTARVTRNQANAAAAAAAPSTSGTKGSATVASRSAGSKSASAGGSSHDLGNGSASAHGSSRSPASGRSTVDESAASSGDEIVSNADAQVFASRLESFLSTDMSRQKGGAARKTRRTGAGRADTASSTPRNWCVSEWFYPGVDYGYFFQGEFKQCLSRLGLDDISGLTRGEWSYVRRLMGFPRRFSQKFVDSERQKLRAMREHVRGGRTIPLSGALAQQSLLEPRLEPGDPVLVLLEAPEQPGSIEIASGTFVQFNSANSMIVSILSDGKSQSPREQVVSDLNVMPVTIPPGTFPSDASSAAALSSTLPSSAVSQRFSEPLMQLQHLLNTPPAVLLSARSVFGGRTALPSAQLSPTRVDGASLPPASSRTAAAATPSTAFNEDFIMVEPTTEEDVSLPLDEEQHRNVAMLVSLLDRKEALVAQLTSIADQVMREREAATTRGEASVPAIATNVRKQYTWAREQLGTIDAQMQPLLAFARARLSLRQSRLESLHRQNTLPLQPATPKQAPGADAWFVQLAQRCNAEAEQLVERVAATQQEVTTSEESAVDPVHAAERARIRQLISACISLLVQVQQLAAGTVATTEPLSSVQVWLALDTALRAMHPVRPAISNRNSEESMVFYKQIESRLQDIFPRVMQACSATPPRQIFFARSALGSAFSPDIRSFSMLSPDLSRIQTALHLPNYSDSPGQQQQQQQQQQPQQQQQQQQQGQEQQSQR